MHSPFCSYIHPSEVQSLLLTVEWTHVSLVGEKDLSKFGHIMAFYLPLHFVLLTLKFSFACSWLYYLSQPCSCILTRDALLTYLSWAQLGPSLPSQRPSETLRPTDPFSALILVHIHNWALLCYIFCGCLHIQTSMQDRMSPRGETRHHFALLCLGNALHMLGTQSALAKLTESSPHVLWMLCRVLYCLSPILILCF